jgi:hypothetical protein
MVVEGGAGSGRGGGGRGQVPLSPVEPMTRGRRSGVSSGANGMAVEHEGGAVQASPIGSQIGSPLGSQQERSPNQQGMGSQARLKKQKTPPKVGNYLLLFFLLFAIFFFFDINRRLDCVRSLPSSSAT